MRLLIVTQIVDKNDPVLGFMHHWLEVFATRFEHIHVICLKAGEYQLPENVRVHSLGKEKGGNRFIYAFRFLKYVYSLHKEYDAVLVHMNPEYIALAGDFWHLTKKRITLWYNHEVGSFWLRLAQPFVHTIFHTSPYAYPARYKNAKQMSAGIDTTLFAPLLRERKKYSIYFQGRVSVAKRVHILLEAVQMMRARGLEATATIVGPEEPNYGSQLRRTFASLIESGAVVFLGPRRNEDTPVLYATHEVAVNLTANGNFDKTVLEACAMETPVVVASKAFGDLVSPSQIVPHQNAAALCDTLTALLTAKDEEKQRLGAHERSVVVAKHSLASLADALLASLSAKRS